MVPAKSCRENALLSPAWQSVMLGYGRDSYETREKRMEQLLDIKYSELDIELRKMDVFVPGDNANGIGLLFIHGGGWHAGARKAWHPVANYFCEKGFSCASTSYRLAPDAHYPSPIEDVRLAMSYFLENAERFRFDAG